MLAEDGAQRIDACSHESVPDHRPRFSRSINPASTRIFMWRLTVGWEGRVSHVGNVLGRTGLEQLTLGQQADSHGAITHLARCATLIPERHRHQLVTRQLANPAYSMIFARRLCAERAVRIPDPYCAMLKQLSIRHTTSMSMVCFAYIVPGRSAAASQLVIHLQNASAAKPLAFRSKSTRSIVVVVAVLAGQSADRPTCRATQ